MTVRMKTTSDAIWTASSAWAHRPTYVTWWLETASNTYNFVGESSSISGLALLAANDSYRIPAGATCDFTVTPSNGAAGDADVAVVSMMGYGRASLALQMRFHNGDPGNAHTANEIAAASNPGYARKTADYVFETA